MADTQHFISRVTLPDGVTYDIKDAAARQAISAGIEFVLVTELPIASPNTMGKIYLVEHDHTAEHEGQGSGFANVTGSMPKVGDYYDEYVVVQKTSQSGGNTWQWELIGNTDVDLSQYSKRAHTHTVTTAAHSYTPAGQVSQPTFTGQQTTSTGEYTPAGTVSAPQVNLSFKDSSNHALATLGIATTSGSVTNGTLPSFTRGAFTPGTLPTMSVSGETLTLAPGTLPSHAADTFSAGAHTQVKLPTITQVDAQATADAPTFTGTKATLSVTGTPAGTVSKPAFTGTAATLSHTAATTSAAHE